MNSNHRVNVVRIAEILPHTNADTLGIVQVGGYQVVVKKDDYTVGDLAIYIQPDSIVPQSPQFDFLWSDREFPDGIVPEKYRRITVRRFRKEWSEGLLLPLREFGITDSMNGLGYINSVAVYEGDDVAELLGITHYEEPEPIANIHSKKAQYKTWPPRSLKGFFYWFMWKIGFDLNGQLGGDFAKPPKNAPPVYDVESLKNYPRTFDTPQEGQISSTEQVIVTEKIHGSNARFMFDGSKMWVGSHKLWKSEKSICIWRRALKEIPWIEKFCRDWPNFTLYGEVVPTQKGYTYGTAEGEIKFFAFDVRSFDGSYIDKRQLYKMAEIESLVPVVYEGPYDAAKIKEIAEGNSLVNGAEHIREGIVISSLEEREVRGVGRAQLKLKSLKFLEKEIK